MSRVARAIAGPISMASRPIANAVDFRISARLVRTLPPKDVIWRIRLTQYVLRLAQAWHQSIGREEIVIFDQAFIQIVSTLALFNGAANETSLSRALEIIPKSDIVIRISASEELRIERLRDRQQRQSFAERLFAARLEMNLRSAQTVNQVCGLLEARGLAPIEVDTSRPLSHPTLNGIEAEILNRAFDRVQKPAA
ncbi:hypothetical protein [Mesorhizobium sp. M2D.F.Ca.ET.140.01.1.1]|uniref:hypothetical protein n=1 Tax=unclassified Mesorhizobium TaxID=325217 RepID=UPI0032AF3E0D